MASGHTQTELALLNIGAELAYKSSATLHKTNGTTVLTND